jgi:hypothetical protein
MLIDNRIDAILGLATYALKKAEVGGPKILLNVDEEGRVYETIHIDKAQNN